jgi:hypothetical protein
VTLHERRCDCWPPTATCSPTSAPTNDTNAIVMSEIYANRHGVEALNKVFDAYRDTITT